MKPILAIILPIGDESVSHPIAPGGPPLGIWGGAPAYPAHPIAPGGSGGVPTPPIYYPPGVNVPVFPSNPIAPGGAPPGYWGGVAPPMPSHPIAPGGAPPVAGWTPPGVQPTPPMSGGLILVYHPYYGWIYLAPGGTPPESGTPTHPIAGTDTKPSQPIQPTPAPKA